MKTKLNQTGTCGAVSLKTVFIWLVALPLVVMAAPEKLINKTSVVCLPAGVSGEEIQMALDNLPAGGGEVVLPPGEFQIRQPVILRS